MGLDRTLNISGGLDSSYFPFIVVVIVVLSLRTPSLLEGTNGRQEESITMPVVRHGAHRYPEMKMTVFFFKETLMLSLVST